MSIVFPFVLFRSIHPSRSETKTDGYDSDVPKTVAQYAVSKHCAKRYYPEYAESEPMARFSDRTTYQNGQKPVCKNRKSIGSMGAIRVLALYPKRPMSSPQSFDFAPKNSAKNSTASVDAFGQTVDAVKTKDKV